MMTQSRSFFRRAAALLLCCAGFCGGFCVAAPPAVSQRPLVLAPEVFRFEPGTWAVYDLHDLSDNTRSRFHFAIHQRQMVSGVQAIWMEVEVRLPAQPAVVTRLLAAETPDGPGKLFQVVVQMEGYKPFKVPSRYFKDQGGTIGQIQPIPLPKTLPVEEVVTCNGKQLHAWKVTAADDRGQPIRATVSEEVPPLCIISAHTPQIEMNLLDWGTGATSRIQGQPMNFYLWILDRMSEELSTPSPPANLPSGLIVEYSRIQQFQGDYSYKAFNDRLELRDNTTGTQQTLRVSGKDTSAGEVFAKVIAGNDELRRHLGPALTDAVPLFEGRLTAQLFQGGAMIHEPASKTIWWGWHRVRTSR